MASGADVKTWLSKSGYIDYLAPQIYWTDNWGYSGTTKMYTTRLNLFNSLNKRKIPIYVGLALYRTGKSFRDDRGWSKRSTNLRGQVKKLRKAGNKGFILYAGSDLYRSGAKKELSNLKKYLKANPR